MCLYECVLAFCVCVFDGSCVFSCAIHVVPWKSVECVRCTVQCTRTGCFFYVAFSLSLIMPPVVFARLLNNWIIVQQHEVRTWLTNSAKTNFKTNSTECREAIGSPMFRNKSKFYDKMPLLFCIFFWIGMDVMSFKNARELCVEMKFVICWN